MTSAEMYQEGQVLLDKVDSQDLAEIQPEQFLIVVNVVIDELVQAARIKFESDSKVRDDASPLVKTLYIKPVKEGNRVKFSYSEASLNREINPDDDKPYTKVYYLVSGYIESSIGEGINKKEGITNYTYVQQDDIQPVLSDPFNKPKYAHKIPVVIEDNSIIGIPPSFLSLDLFVGRFIVQPAKVTQTVNCDLPEQLHHSIVKATVAKLLEGVESPRVATFQE